MSEVKEVTAWAVVDKDGRFDCDNVFDAPFSAREDVEIMDRLDPHLAPHRVIRVRIVPDTEEQK